MVIGIVGSAMGAGTLAYFSDTETSEDNTFAAGSIDLKVDFDGYFNKLPDGMPNAGTWELDDLDEGDRFFNFADLKPGDFGEGTISLHVYTNDAWACMTVTPKKNDDMSSTEPELETGDAQEDPNNLWDGELAGALTGMIWADIGKYNQQHDCTNTDAIPGDNIYNPECGDIKIGTGIAPTSNVILPLADMNGNVFTGHAGDPLIGSRDYYIGISWSLPGPTTGNNVQSDSYVADISFTAEQKRNNDRFVCQ